MQFCGKLQRRQLLGISSTHASEFTANIVLVSVDEYQCKCSADGNEMYEAAEKGVASVLEYRDLLNLLIAFTSAPSEQPVNRIQSKSFEERLNFRRPGVVSRWSLG